MHCTENQNIKVIVRNDYLKLRGAFSSEQALLKLICLIIKNISRKWTMPVHNWGLAMSQLYIKFSDRIFNENKKL